MREGLALVERRLVATLRKLRAFALAHRDLPALAYTHFQPAQPTTVGKRATLWAADLLMDLEEVRAVGADLRFLGAKGTTGTQASFLAPLRRRPAKVEELDRALAARAGFAPPAARLGPDLLAQAGRPRRRTRSRAWRSPPHKFGYGPAPAAARGRARGAVRERRRSAPPRWRTSATRCGPSASARSRAT